MAAMVCAAVSALAISTVNGIDALAGFEPIVEVDDVKVATFMSRC